MIAFFSSSCLFVSAFLFASDGRRLGLYHHVQSTVFRFVLFSILFILVV